MGDLDVFWSIWSISSYLYVGVFLFLYVLPALLIREYSQLGERMIEQVRDQQLITRGHWPDEMPTLLALMEQTGWPRDDELRLWWWGETYPILVRWLPRLQPSELGTNECRTLRKLLRLNHQYEDLQVAILLALGTVRDAKAQRVATKLLQRSPHERVREAAQDCLKALKSTD